MNSCYMLNKLSKIILLTVTSLFNVSSSKIEPLSIVGEITMPDLYEDIYLNLKVDKGLLNERILIDICINGDYLYKEKGYIAHYLDDQPIVLQGFKNSDEIKKIDINVKYRDMIAAASSVAFTINAPSYKEIILPFENESNFISKNPIKVSFNFKGSNSNVYYEYESIGFIGQSIINLYNKRIVHFEDLSFYINSVVDYYSEYVEIRLYYDFDSDLLYKDNEYTVIELPVNKQIDGIYVLQEETEYFISEKDGNIYINENEYTNKDMLPFFIPLFNNEDMTIAYEIVLYDIGLNHNTYIYQGEIILTTDNENNFSYQLIKEPLYDIAYE